MFREPTELPLTGCLIESIWLIVQLKLRQFLLMRDISGFAVRSQMFAARNAATWSGAVLHVRASEQAAGIERGVLRVRIASPIKLSPSVKAS